MCKDREGGRGGPYNCDSVVVNVSSLVEFLLELSVTFAGSVRGYQVSDNEVDRRRGWEYKRTGHRRGAEQCDLLMWQPF